MARLLSPEAFAKSWDKRVVRFNKQVEQTVANTALFGKITAQGLAPKDTTTLAQSVTYSLRNKKSAIIYVRRVNNPLGGVTTKYASVMHNVPLGKAKNIWRSGDPHFMFTTRDRVKKKLNKDIISVVGELTGKSSK